MPAASSPPGSHLPKKKPKKKKYNPPNVGGAIKNAGSEATKAGGGKPSKKEREAAAKAHAAVVKANVAVAKAVSTTKPKKMKKGYYTRQLSGKKASGDSLTTEDKEQLRKVRELNKEYEESSTLSKVLLPPSGVAAGDAPFMGPIKSGSNVLSAIKSIATGGSKKAAVKTAASGTAKGLPKSAVPSAAKGAKAEAKLGKAIAKSAKAEAKAAAKGAKKSVPRSKRLKTWAKAQPKKRRPTITSGKKAIYGASAERARKAIIAGGIGGGTLAGPTAGLVQNSIEAAKEDPGKFFSTSKSGLLALATAPVKIPIEVAVGLKHGTTEPITKQLEAYKKYVEDYGTLTDPGSPEAIRKLQNKYGTTPLITGGLALHGATRPLRSAPVSKLETAKEPKIARQGLKVRRVSTLKKEAKSSDPGVANAAKETLMNAEKYKLTRKQEVAREVARGKRRGQARTKSDLMETGRETRTTRKGRTPLIRKGKTYEQALTELHSIPIGKKGDRTITLADAWNLVGTHGIPTHDVAATVKALEHLRDSLTKSNKVADASALETRPVIDALLEHPEYLQHPDFDVLRAAARRNDKANKPSQVARYTPIAREFDVPHSTETVPFEIRDITRHTPEKYVKAKGAIKAEAASDRSRAKTLRREATARQRKATAEARLKVERQRSKAKQAEGSERVAHARAKDRLTKADRARLNKVPEFVKARAALNRAKKELANARKNYHAEAQYPGHMRRGDETLATARTRLDRAEQNMVNAQKRYDAVVDRLYRKGEEAASAAARGDKHDANLAGLGRGVFTAAEKASAAAMEAQRALGEAKLNLGRVREGDPLAVAKREEAKTLEGNASLKTSAVTRLARARRMEADAYKAKMSGDKAKAKLLKVQARELRKEEQASQMKRDAEMIRGARAALTDNGREDIIFLSQRSTVGTGPARGGKDIVAVAAKKHKQRLGKLAEEGLVEQSGASVIEKITRDHLNFGINESTRVWLDREVARHPRIYNADEMRRAMETGDHPVGTSPFALQEFKRAYQQGEWEHMIGMMDPSYATRELLSEADFHGKGHKYVFVSTSGLKEMKAQYKDVGRIAQTLKGFGAASSYMMLSTSASWAFYQGFATPLIILAAHPNPVDHYKTAKFRIGEYRSLDPRVRREVEANFGGNVVDQVSHLKLDRYGPTPDTVRTLQGAAKTMERSWAGKLLHKFGDGGGPLMRTVARYEGGWRTYGGLLEAEKLYGKNTGLGRFVKSLAGHNDKLMKEIDKVSKMSRKERTAYLADPRNTAAVDRSMLTTLGDWTSMTALEKTATAAFVFYPFVRFSLRWAFHMYPRDHPFKASVLLNMAQQNANEVKQMLGGDPQWYQTLGYITYRNSEGNLDYVDMTRAAPAGNAITEAIAGSEDLNLSSFSRFINPLIAGAALQGIGGLDPFSGEKVGGSIGQNLALFGQQVLGLNPLSRNLALPAYQEAIPSLEKSPSAQYFKQLDGRSALDKAINPISGFFGSPAKAEAEWQAGEILRKASDAPTPEELTAEAQQIVADNPGLNKNELSQLPEVQDLIQRARSSDKAKETWRAVLENAGLGIPDEEFRTTGNLFELINPIGGFSQKPLDKRTEAQRVKFFKKQGLTNEQIEQQHPNLPASYSIQIERLRKQGMTDAQIARDYPKLRPHLSVGGGESSSVMDQYRNTGTDIMDKYRSGTSSVMDKYR